MDLKEAVKKLKVLLSSDEAKAVTEETTETVETKEEVKEENTENTEEVVNTTEQNFTDAKLNDGTTIVSYDAEKLEAGVIVYIVDESGERLPLPIGSYELEDGTTFDVVDESGAIDNIVLAGEEAPAEEAPAATPSAEGQEQKEQTNPKKVIETVSKESIFNAEEEIAKLKESFEAQLKDLNEKFEAEKAEKENLEKDLEESKELNKEIFETIEKIEEAPSKAPAEATKKQKFNVAAQRQEFKDSILELEAKLTKENAI